MLKAPTISPEISTARGMSRRALRISAALQQASSVPMMP